LVLVYFKILFLKEIILKPNPNFLIHSKLKNLV
jgi:hypothetical protein